MERTITCNVYLSFIFFTSPNLTSSANTSPRNTKPTISFCNFLYLKQAIRFALKSMKFGLEIPPRCTSRIKNIQHFERLSGSLTKSSNTSFTYFSRPNERGVQSAPDSASQTFTIINRSIRKSESIHFRAHNANYLLCGWIIFNISES